MKIPKFVYASVILDCLLLICLLYFQPPISTVLIFAMGILGFWGILRLKTWVDKEEKKDVKA